MRVRLPPRTLQARLGLEQNRKPIPTGTQPADRRGPGQPRSGQFQRRHHQSVLADEARYAMDLPQRGGGRCPQDIVVVATTTTKKLANGITARVVRDTARVKGQIIEDTIDWYAQDADGNVWYMGEQTAEFENGKIVSRAGSWEAGKDGAMPGIMLPAEPQVGQKYRQEYKKGEAEDNGEVLATNHLVEVTAGSYKKSLVTMDTSAVEPTAVEYKFYAPGVGPVLALDTSGGAAREELVKIDKAAPKDGTGPIGKPNP